MHNRILFTALCVCALFCGCGGSGSAPGAGNAAGPGPGAAPGATSQLSNDPFTDSTAQHQTAVEPSIFSNGSTLVSAFQVGRIQTGASDAIGYATSTNGGTSWTQGILPSLTAVAGGPNLNVTDSVVTYDQAHGVWMVESLGFTSSASQVVVSRSTDGLNWNAPVTVSTSSDYDKCWIACDNGATSPNRGTCYAEWDDVANGQKILMSRSTDGGLTWSAPVGTADSATGLGGQIAIQPNGNVVVPFFNGNSSNPEILSYSSSDGGLTWGSSALIVATQPASIPVRGETDPQITVDSNGKIYVAWYDCRFESSCTSNDTVMVSSSDGVTWSAVSLIPTDPVGSGINHFLPTLAVNPANPGNLALMVYTSNTAQCPGTSCTIQPVINTSTDGGASWSSATSLWPAFAVTSIANTTEGLMVGDYFSMAFVGNTAFPAFAAAATPVPAGFAYNEQIFTTAINAE